VVVAAALREALSRASYDADSVDALVRVDGLDMLPGLSALRLRPAADEPLGRLVRLFLAGDEVDAEAAAAALAPAAVDDLEAEGIIERVADGMGAQLCGSTPPAGC
jgi:hypothetical protein